MKPMIAQLLEDLGDTRADGPQVTCSGPTGHDPARDFPVCRRAVEELVARGAEAVPPLLALIRGPLDRRMLFAAEALGRLAVVEAIPDLERLVRERACVSHRVNYDQYIDYEIHEAARIALERLARA
jgi:hypothetical protein